MRKAEWLRPSVGMLFEQNFEDFRAKGTLENDIFKYKQDELAKNGLSSILNSTSKCSFYISVFPDVYSASLL